ncbi:uncharacterized protein LOC141533258 [Cotesia typhae]|uniref:uncharacterized protein LOC141533258 n=1 Tax=Cotesia typhae TaxID=2053667 RepID=UPI003D6840BA
MPGHDRPFTKRKEMNLIEFKRGDDFDDNLPDSEDFVDICFVVSNKWTDASQSTVPFMDRRLVAASPRVPLKGIFIFYRGREKSGGFLGFRLRTISLHDYINPDMKPENAVLYQKGQKDIPLNILLY